MVTSWLIYSSRVKPKLLLWVKKMEKDADLAIFDGYPFSNLTNCVMTIIDGEKFVNEN